MNTDFDTLPDGSRFAFWDCTTQFRRTWHVAQAARNANDNIENEVGATSHRSAEDVLCGTIGQAARAGAGSQPGRGQLP